MNGHGEDVNRACCSPNGGPASVAPWETGITLNRLAEKIAARLAERNPFDAVRVQPGRLPYRFCDGQSATQLVEQLRHNAWKGEIVGPRGSGKSTLVRTIIPFLQQAGRDVKLFTLQAGESRLCIPGSDLQTWNESTQVAIDGYEQLGSWTRTLLSRICRNQGCGLLQTSLKPTGVPVLYWTQPTLELVQALARELQSNTVQRVFEPDVAESYERQRGSVREVLHELHNLYERRRGTG